MRACDAILPPGTLPHSAHATFALRLHRCVCRVAQMVEEYTIGSFARPKPRLQKEAAGELLRRRQAPPPRLVE